MSTAHITPQRDGTAVFELNGMTHQFRSTGAAWDEALRLKLPCKIGPFPNLPVEVLAVSPALQAT